MSKHQASSRGAFTVGKLAGTVAAAGVVLFAAPAATAFADPLGDLGHAVNSTVNQVNTVVQGNVNGTNGILQGNVNNTNTILRGLLGLH